MAEYHVYVLASHSRVIYVGVTGDLRRRVYEHKHRLTAGFTSRYQVDRLVHFESTTDVRSAIAREKEIKGWVRRRKVELIERENPGWRDSSANWGIDPSVVPSGIRSEGE